MAIQGQGFTDRELTEAEIAAILDQALGAWDLVGKRVLILIPDTTRSCPMPQLFRLLYERLADEVEELDFLVALGTHPPMTDAQIYHHVGISAEAHKTTYPRARFFNHLWKDPTELVKVGTLTAADVAEITDGLFEMDVTITCNRRVQEHDVVILLGPVFPHEVVGFSGGNKYLFPGVAGQAIIDFFHWFGAVITNKAIIGRKWTPVRKVVDRAAALLTVERKALCMVVKDDRLAGLYAGAPEEAWSAAADLSNQLHIRYTGRAYDTVLSCAPAMYDDIWTAGKCMYKLEPVVADGGTLIIYAPHVTEISAVHGHVLHEIGYHTRDFFLAQWDKYKVYPWGVVAHSTHVKGTGTYENGVEHPRVNVVLATGIPREICEQVNLGYMDHRSIDQADYEGREEEGVLCVPKAGEILYRMNPADELCAFG